MIDLHVIYFAHEYCKTILNVILLSQMSEIYHMEELVSMKKFENLSLAQSYKLRYTINGIAWLVYSFFRLFDNIASRLICIAAMVVVIICLVSFFRKGEEEDEMAMKHIYRAKAHSFDVIFGVVLILGLISVAGANFQFNLNDVYGFVVAATNIFIGCIFSHLEKVGD